MVLLVGCRWGKFSTVRPLQAFWVTEEKCSFAFDWRPNSLAICNGFHSYISADGWSLSLTTSQAVIGAVPTI